MIVTEQSHVFECRRWCVLISKVIRGLCVQHIRALVVSVRRLSFLCRMAHFSAFDDSTASLFVRVRIRFYPCNNHYLAGFVLQGPAICFSGKKLCYHGYLSSRSLHGNRIQPVLPCSLSNAQK